ncbi:MAG: biotin/lipoyl-binding protein [Candidatus Brocadiaceae bacterium]|nr:biotin/lipoyl-binding protein [Candidatus Brocadiaceae bacterium]
MRVEVELQDLDDNSGNEATVSFWYIEEDEEVEEGDDLVEMITEKATFNVTAPVSGKLVDIFAQEGDIVKVGDVIAIVNTEGEEDADEYEDEEENEDED